MSKFGSVNKVILVGRAGSDPEIRNTPNGAAVANLSLATNRSYKDKEGNWQEETDWHRVVVWSKQAEFCRKYVKKGNRVYVEGRLQTRAWNDNDGNKRYTTEVVCNDLQLLESAARENGQAETVETPDGGDKYELPF